MQHQYISQDELQKLRTSLIGKLNKERTSLKLDALYRCRRGDISAQELINKNITSTAVGSGFREIMRNNNVVAEQFEIFTMELTHQTFLQMPIADEAKEGFSNVFEKMLKQSYSHILLNRCQPTHISIGMKQAGLNGEMFQVLLLMSIKPITILQIVKAVSDIDGEAKITIGNVLSSSLIPTLIVIDQGLQSELRLGTSQMIYDPTNSQEIKFAVYDNQTQISPFNKVGQSTSIDIYMVNSDQTPVINYGGNQDAPQQQNWFKAYSDFMPKIITPTKMSPFNALKDPNLRETIKKAPKGPPSGLQQRLMIKQPSKNEDGSLANQINSAVGNINNMIGGGNVIKKTNAQILKERKAKEIRDKQNSSNPLPVIAMGPSMTAQNGSFGNKPILQNQNCFKSGLQIQQSSNNQNSFKSRGNFSFGIDNQSFISNKQQGKYGLQNQQITQIQNDAWRIPPFQNNKPSSNNQRSQWQVAPNQEKQANAQIQNNVSSFSFSGTNNFPFKTTNQISQPAQPQNNINFIVGRQDNNDSKGMIQSKLKFSSNNPFNNGGQNFGSKKIEAMPLGQSQLNFNPSQQPSKKIHPQPLQENLNFQSTQNQIQAQAPLKFNFVQPSGTQNKIPQSIQMNIQQFQPLNFPTNQQNNLTQQLIQQPLYQQQPVQQQQSQFIQNNPPIAQQNLNVLPLNGVQDQNLSELQRNILQVLWPHLNQQSPPIDIILYELQRLEELYSQPNKTQNHIQQLSEVETMIMTQPSQFLQLISQAHGLQIGTSQIPAIDLGVGNREEKKRGLFESEKKELLSFENAKRMMAFGQKGQFVMSMIRFEQISKSNFNDALQKIWTKYQPDIQLATTTEHHQQICQQIVDGILRTIYLKELPPKNDSFVQLYKEHLDASQDLSSRAARESDLSLLLRGNKFKCHQFIFKNNSQFFKNLILKKENEIKQSRSHQKQNQFLMKFEMPKWINIQSFKMFIRFLYLGTFNYEGDKANLDFNAIFEIYRTAWYFQHPILQDHVVIDGLIPQMTLKNAIYALNELKLMKRDETRESQILLNEYCIHVIALNLPYQLLSEKLKLCSLENIVLQQIICKSLIFLSSDDDTHVDLIMKFTAETFAQNNVFQLMKNLIKKYKGCQGFDSQNTKLMGEFIRSIDPTQDNFCNLIIDDNHRELEQNKQLDSSLQIEENNFSIDFDNAYADQEENFDPKKNFETDMTGKPKEPTRNNLAFSYKIKYEDLKKQQIQRARESPNGLSIVTKSFDAARRSWHLKIDYDTQKNLSVYIVERGLPQEKQSLGENGSIPQFSSVLFTLEVMNKKIPFFFSFAHNTNQVIGVKNFTNLTNLADEDQINIKIYSKEQIVHSAMAQYISTNFTRLFKQSVKSDGSSQSLYTLPASTIYQILRSNTLKVDDENTVLTFLYNYAGGRHIEKLSPCLRYSFVDISKLFSAIKQNQFFAESQFFKKRCEEEMIKRTTQEDRAKDEFRKFYDLQKIKSNSKEGQVTEMLKDMINWAAKSSKVKNQNNAKNEYGLNQRSVKKEYDFDRNSEVERRKIDPNERPIHLNNLNLSKIAKPPVDDIKQNPDIFGFKSITHKNPFKHGSLAAKPVQDQKKRDPPKFLVQNKENRNPISSFNNSLFSVKLNMNETIQTKKNEKEKSYSKLFAQLNGSPQAIKKEAPKSIQKRANSAGSGQKPAKEGLQVKYETRTKLPIQGQNKDKEEGGILTTFTKMLFK